MVDHLVADSIAGMYILGSTRSGSGSRRDFRDQPRLDQARVGRDARGFYGRNSLGSTKPALNDYAELNNEVDLLWTSG